MPRIAKLIALTLAALVGLTAPEARAVPVTLNFSVTPEITDTFDNVDVSVTFENSTPGVQPSPGVFDYVGSVTSVEADFFFMSALLGTVSFAPTGPGDRNALGIANNLNLGFGPVDGFTIVAGALTSAGTGIFAGSTGPAGLILEISAGPATLDSAALTGLTQTVFDNNLSPVPGAILILASEIDLPNPSIIDVADIRTVPAGTRVTGSLRSTVIPLPATLPLLLAGMAGLAVMRRGRG